jgi:hypothetical protein
LDHSSLQEILCLDAEDQVSSAEIEEDFNYRGKIVHSFHTKVDNIARLTGRHFPIKKNPYDRAQGKRQKKICRICYARGIKTAKGGHASTVWICGDCPSQPGLHVDEGCFKIYHTQLEFAHSSHSNQ